MSEPSTKSSIELADEILYDKIYEEQQEVNRKMVARVSGKRRKLTTAPSIKVDETGLSPNSNISIRGKAKTNSEENVSAGGHSSGHLVDEPRTETDHEIGMSKLLYQYLSENPTWHNKREVAEIIDSSYKDGAFIKAIQRGRIDKRIEVSPGGDKIRYINKRWQDFVVDTEVLNRPLMDIKLPFGAESLVDIPEKTEIVVAGDGGLGKTHWGYHLADLNLNGKLPIRHFVVEDGDQRMTRNLVDFPDLLEAFKAKDGRYHLINPSKGDGLNVPENLDPNGINIWDYFRVPDRNDWYLGVQKEMIKCNEALDTGIVVIMIQKKGGERAGYGRDFTLMQCSLAFSLNLIRKVQANASDYGHKEGYMAFEKARDPSTPQTPELMACGYRTAPLHGKLVPDMQGWIARENFEDKIKE